MDMPITWKRCSENVRSIREHHVEQRILICQQTRMNVHIFLTGSGTNVVNLSSKASIYAVFRAFLFAK